MVQRILVELLLFLTPFAIFFVYRAASRDMKIRDRWPLTTLVIAGTVLAVGALVIGPLLQPSSGGKCYVAARYENGVTVPAQQVDCEAATLPDKPGAPPPAPPVAPRDENRP
jgi:hypothetical protein